MQIETLVQCMINEWLPDFSVSTSCFFSPLTDADIFRSSSLLSPLTQHPHRRLISSIFYAPLNELHSDEKQRNLTRIQSIIRRNYSVKFPHYNFIWPEWNYHWHTMYIGDEDGDGVLTDSLSHTHFSPPPPSGNEEIMMNTLFTIAASSSANNAYFILPSIQLRVSLESAKFQKESWLQATSFAWKQFKDPMLVRWFKELSLLGMQALPDQEYQEVCSAMIIDC